jgi:hypothetical protein
MQLVIAAISDHAWVEKGCLSICRTIDTIVVSKFPHIQSRLSIALRGLYRRSETGIHKIKIILMDEDGKAIMSTNGEINLHPPKDAIIESSFAFVLNGQNIKFSKPGTYSVDFLIDGNVKASLSLYVRKKQKE